MAFIVDSKVISVPLTQIPLSCFDRGFSYLAHSLSITCRLQQKLECSDMTLQLKVKVKYVKNMSFGL